MLGEKFSVGFAELLPERDVRDEHSGSNHVFEFAPYVSERLLDPQPVDVGGRVAVHFDCAPGFGRPPLITGRDAGHETRSRER